MPDSAQYDFFATQFATSIVRESGESENYWFGRMLRYLETDEFVFRNFFGADYTEDDFRKSMINGTIDVTVFNISNVSYTVDPNDSTLATATCDVEIEANVNNVRKSGNFTLTHKIKQGWQTYESTLS
jgi:hypothetical protein